MKTGCSWQDLTLVGRILLILFQTSEESCHERAFYRMAPALPGESRIALDAAAPLGAAASLCRKLGFEEIEPYYRNPFDGATFFGVDL